MSGFAEADRINNRVNLIRERFQRGQEQVLNELLNMNSVDGCNFNLPTANIPSECLQTITDLYMQRENHGGDLNKKIDANRLIAAFQRILQGLIGDNQQQQRDEVIQPLIFLPILLLIFFILFYIIYYNKIQAEAAAQRQTEAREQAEAAAQRRAFQEIMQFVPREIQMNLERTPSCRGDDCKTRHGGGGNDDKLLINNLIDAFIKRYNEVKKLDKDDNKVIQILNKFKDIISKGETVKQLETELTELTKLKISDGGGKRRKSKRRKTRKRKSKKRRKRRRRGKSLKKRTSSRKR
tara:strand:+ start:834 stop:1718 length:885 start_codon:yes stop_codon:yes gene_type:complete